MSLWNRLGRLSNEGHLRGLPEMTLFPDEAAREHAIQQIYAEEIYAKEHRAALVGALLLHAIVIVVVFFGLVYLIRSLLPSLQRWSGHIGLAVVLPLYILYIAVSLRRSMVKDLRRKLVQAGIPVCLRCGYDLRGSDATRCPECGTERPDGRAGAGGSSYSDAGGAT